jgi:hypothetical protein
VKLFIDSGAFSAWRRGKPVDLEAYCDWLLENEEWIDVVAALDEIIPDDPELAAKRSFDNLVYMRSRGIDAVPVWHVREGTDWIKRILDLGCSYVGLSATSIVSRTATDDWYEMAWSYLVDSQGAPLVRVHSFGERREDILCRYPWTSADSSSWLEGQRWGALIIPGGSWLGHSKRGKSTPSRQDIDSLEGHDLAAFDSVVESLGVRREALADRSSRDARIARSIIMAARFREIQASVRSRLPIRFSPSGGGLITGPRPPAVRRHEIPDEFSLFLAVGANNLALSSATRLRMHNLLISYFYINERLTSRLRAYKRDPEGAMRTGLYAKHSKLLDRVMIDASQHTPSTPIPVRAASEFSSLER